MLNKQAVLVESSVFYPLLRLGLQYCGWSLISVKSPKAFVVLKKPAIYKKNANFKIEMGYWPVTGLSRPHPKHSFHTMIPWGLGPGASACKDMDFTL